MALLGWQTGVFHCGPRDRWLGWHKAAQFWCLHLIDSSTRFLVSPQGEGIPNLASRALAMNLRRLKCLPFLGPPPEGETRFQPAEPVEEAKGGCSWTVRARRKPCGIGVTRAWQSSTRRCGAGAADASAARPRTCTRASIGRWLTRPQCGQPEHTELQTTLPLFADYAGETPAVNENTGILGSGTFELTVKWGDDHGEDNISARIIDRKGVCGSTRD